MLFTNGIYSLSFSESRGRVIALVSELSVGRAQWDPVSAVVTDSAVTIEACVDTVLSSSSSSEFRPWVSPRV